VKNVRFHFLIAAVAFAAIAASTALASASTTVTFKGSYAGTVTEKVDGQTVTALATAAGTGTAVGKGRLNGTVTATTANPPCSPLSGPGTIGGLPGKLKLSVVPTSRGCAASEDDQNNITISGTAKVVGGTLKFRKARGSFHFSGHYDRQAGTFTVKLTGTLTY
jgi:hypothetical protein